MNLILASFVAAPHIGCHPARAKSLAQAARMKSLLVDWLAHVKSPLLESVRQRAL
jgi:hypothetical protein